MPIRLELALAPATFLLQEQIEATVVFLPAPGEEWVTFPAALSHPEVLSLRLRHEDGGVEDRSPVAGGPESAPAPAILRSWSAERRHPLPLAPPGRPGAWTVELAIRMGDRLEVAPEIGFTVLPAELAAVAVQPAVHAPGAPVERILLLGLDGALVEQAILGRELGTWQLGAGYRVGQLPGASAILPAAAIPGAGGAWPYWVVARRGGEALALRVGESTTRAGPVPLRGADEPEPILLGPPLQTDEQGRLLLGWAVGARLRVAILGASGLVTGPLELALPGPILRGVAVGGTDRGVDLFVEVEEPTQPLPPGSSLPRLGSTDDLPDPTSDRPQLIFPKGRPPRSAPAPLHGRYLWRAHVPDGRPGRLPPPTRVAALPTGTVAMTGTSAGLGGPAALWVLERQAGLLEATVATLAAGRLGLSIGAPVRKPIRIGVPLDGEQADAPAALLCPGPGELRLAWVLRKALLLAGTSEPAQTLPLPDPAPDFVGLFAGGLVLHDEERGSWLG